VTNNDCTIWMHRLARRVCRAYHWVPYDEALSAALVGMARALHEFDPERQLIAKRIGQKGYFATIDQLRAEGYLIHPNRTNRERLVFRSLTCDVPCRYTDKTDTFADLVSRCSLRQQVVLEMEFVDGLSMEKIAKRFGTNGHTVKRWKDSALQRVKAGCL